MKVRIEGIYKITGRGRILSVRDSRLFCCVGDFDVRWAAPISPENMEMIERIKKEMKL